MNRKRRNSDASRLARLHTLLASWPCTHQQLSPKHTLPAPTTIWSQRRLVTNRFVTVSWCRIGSAGALQKRIAEGSRKGQLMGGGR